MVIERPLSAQEQAREAEFEAEIAAIVNPHSESAAGVAPEKKREPLKTLATCKPSEFLRQTYRIKKLAEVWLTETDILNIRKNVPTLPPIIITAPAEEQEAQRKANEEALKKAGLRNFSRMFDAIAGEHPDETLALLALSCFVEPEHADDYEIGDYLDALSRMLAHRATLNFFTSLLQLARLITPDTLKP